VLATHGWLDNASTFDLLAPRLEGCEVVALDLAGHGLSGSRSPDAAYNIWEDVGDLLAVCEQLGWARCNLLGHSRGAAIAMLFAGAFPEHVDFITSPGHRAHGHTRGELGMPGAGPVRVITDRGTLVANPDTGELELNAIYPDASVGDIRSAVGWDLAVRDPLATVDPPTPTELKLLRDVVDPQRLFLR